jgi:hypothetical protein
LDAAADSSLWKEIAARRWMCLWMVVNDSDWRSAEAFLPLSTTPGLTARQQQQITKFTKAAAPVLPRSTSRPSQFNGSSVFPRRSSSSGYSSSRFRGGRNRRDVPSRFATTNASTTAVDINQSDAVGARRR